MISQCQPSTLIFDLEAFQAGYVTVRLFSIEGNAAGTIYSDVPGTIRRADYFGPKDWSPRSSIPKQWKFVCKLPIQADISLEARFTNVHVLDPAGRYKTCPAFHCRSQKKPSALYFIPAVPEALR